MRSPFCFVVIIGEESGSDESSLCLISIVLLFTVNDNHLESGLSEQPSESGQNKASSAEIAFEKSESLSRLLKTMTVFFLSVFENNTTKCCVFYMFCIPLQR